MESSRMRRTLMAALGCAALAAGCSRQAAQDGAGDAPGTASPAGPGHAPARGMDSPADKPSVLGEKSWDVVLQWGEGITGPRMAELFLEHSADLEFVSAEPAEAARTAGKQVTAQLRGPGLVRVVVMSTSNMERIPAGPLCTLRYRRTALGPAAVGVRLAESSLAPQEFALTPSSVRLEVAP